MKLPRRNFLHLAAGAAALPTISRVARAQAYPARPVRFLVPFPAGGPSDVLARLYGQKLSQRWNQPVVVENRVGPTGTIGTEAVVRAPLATRCSSPPTCQSPWRPRCLGCATIHSATWLRSLRSPRTTSWWLCIPQQEFVRSP